MLRREVEAWCLCSNVDLYLAPATVRANREIEAPWEGGAGEVELLIALCLAASRVRDVEESGDGEALVAANDGIVEARAGVVGPEVKTREAGFAVVGDGEGRVGAVDEAGLEEVVGAGWGCEGVCGDSDGGGGVKGHC